MTKENRPTEADLEQAYNEIVAFCEEKNYSFYSVDCFCMCWLAGRAKSISTERGLPIERVLESISKSTAEITQLANKRHVMNEKTF